MSFLVKNLNLIKEIVKISKDAGKSILDIYNKSNSDFEMKKDNTPLTEADISANNIIMSSLKDLTPKIPIISEESCNIPFEVRSKWKCFWLIDPLDGTKEFIKGNGEFTVNIALIENNTPTLGVIHIPAKNETYWGTEEYGSYYSKGKQRAKKIQTSIKQPKKVRLATSRSHPSKELESYIGNLGKYKIITKGSSLKFCLIASGKADIYPRFGKTSEWDIAAGDAILKYSGGCIIDLNGNQLKYNSKTDFINPYFIASGFSIIGSRYFENINKHIKI